MRDIELKKEGIEKLILEALSSWEQRNSFVEELKNDYVITYFWVKYNDMQRTFNPTENLIELLKIFRP
jgi:hypothetical protein